MYEGNQATQPNTPATGQPQAAPKGFASENGTLILSGGGTSGTFAYNGTLDVDGGASSRNASGSYNGGTGGAFQLVGPDTDSGYISHDGNVLAFTKDPGTDRKPELFVAARTGVGQSNASLNGAYGVVAYQFKPGTMQPVTTNAGTPMNAPLGFSVTNGVVSFDGAGHASFSGTEDTDGTGSAQSASLTYSVGATGSLAISADTSNTGFVSADGSVLVFTRDAGSGGSPQVFIAVKKGATPGNAVLNGSYGVVAYGYGGGTQPNTTATGTPQAVPTGFNTENGTVAFDGAGHFSFNGSRDTDGVGSAESTSGTYTVSSSDGALTITADNSNSGYVGPGGNVLIFSAAPAAGSSPRLFVAVRK
jgi:hypothetical protein